MIMNGHTCKLFENIINDVQNKGDGEINTANITMLNQRTIGPVKAHLITWPCKAQKIQNLENIW